MPDPITVSHRLVAALLAVGVAACGTSMAFAQARTVEPAASTPKLPRAGTRPTWSQLTPDQKKALAPLAASWSQLSEAHKRKWIALAANFGQLAPDEQSKLQARMKEWVALSPQQRTQARLNFGETQQLSADEKKAKWQAYQALSPEERQRLAAAGRAARTPATAAAVKPVPADKLATVPRPFDAEPRPARIVIQPAEAATPAGGH